MSLFEMGKIEIRVIDIVGVEFKLTKEQYLERFKVDGRIDLDVKIDADFSNDLKDLRTTTLRLVPKTLSQVSNTTVNIGFIGLSREPRRQPVGDNEFLERDADKDDFTKIEGLPETSVIKCDAELDNATLEDLAKSEDTYRLSQKYTIENPPLEVIPIRISGRFIRDYEEYCRRRNKGIQIEEEYLGKSSLTLDVKNITRERPVEVSELRISFAETFPRLSWSPQKFGQLLPEKRELVFQGVRIEPEQSQAFDIITNLESVLQLGVVKGQLRAEIDSYTISGVKADKFFLPNGFAVPSTQINTEQLTRVLANIELDPTAMEDTLLKSQTLVFETEELPRDVFDDLLRFFRIAGYFVPDRTHYREPTADNLRANIWHEEHEVDNVRRVFDDAVVRLSADINGEWGEVTEEREVESGGTRTERGKRSRYGKCKVTVIAQSTNEVRMSECLEEVTGYFAKRKE